MGLSLQHVLGVERIKRLSRGGTLPFQERQLELAASWTGYLFPRPLFS